MRFDVSKALKKTVVLLSGEEFLLRSRALQELVSAGSAGEDFDTETFMADSTGPTQWLAAAGTAPFLSPRRTLIVRNLCRSDAHKEFNPRGLPDTALLILVADDEPGESDKQRRVTASRKAWEKAVSSVGGELYLFAVDPKDIVREIKAEAESHGKRIADSAAETLKEMSGGVLSRALEELEKLVLYAGNEPQIRESDVRAVVVASPEWSVYKLVDAISQGHNGEALRQLKLLVGNTNKVEDVALSSIFPTLSTQFRLVWQARICVEAKTTPSDAPEDVRALFPDRPNLAREQEWRQRRAMQSARSLDFPALTSCLNAISDADARIKGLLPSFSGIETLERMVLEMIEAVRPLASARR